MLCEGGNGSGVDGAVFGHGPVRTADNRDRRREPNVLRLPPDPSLRALQPERLPHQQHRCARRRPRLCRLWRRRTRWRQGLRARGPVPHPAPTGRPVRSAQRQGSTRELPVQARDDGAARARLADSARPRRVVRPQRGPSVLLERTELQPLPTSPDYKERFDTLLAGYGQSAAAQLAEDLADVERRVPDATARAKRWCRRASGRGDFGAT
jgi:hypothetical protein